MELIHVSRQVEDEGEEVVPAQINHTARQLSDEELLNNDDKSSYLLLQTTMTWIIENTGKDGD